jgi:TolB protein
VKLPLYIGLAIALPAGAGAGEQQLTFDGTNKRDPSFINDGQSVVYSYDEKEDLVRAVRIEIDDLRAGPTPLFDDGPSHQLEIAFSSDGRYTAFNQCTGNLTGKLVIRDLEEKKDAEINHSGRGAYRTPVFTPDCTRVIYAFAETGPMQLWSVDLEGKDKKQVTETEGLTKWPNFSPDGKELIFANSRENNYEIYRLNLKTGAEIRLTENRLMDVRPRISPDGKRICFTSTRDGNYEIYVMNIDGSHVQRITDSEERDDYPNWHPDGNRIVYVSEREGRMDLFLVDVGGAKAPVASN